MKLVNLIKTIGKAYDREESIEINEFSFAILGRVNSKGHITGPHYISHMHGIVYVEVSSLGVFLRSWFRSPKGGECDFFVWMDVEHLDLAKLNAKNAKNQTYSVVAVDQAQRTISLSADSSVEEIVQLAVDRIQNAMVYGTSATSVIVDEDDGTNIPF